MEKGFFYEYDLSINLETQVDLYEQDRERYWNEKSEEIPLADVLYDQAERFAKTILSNTEQMVSTEQLDDDVRALDRELVEIHKWETTINQGLKEIWESEDSFENKKRRMLELLHQRPSDAQEDNSSLRLVWERLHIKVAWDAVSKIKEGADKMLKLYRLVLKDSPSKATQSFLSRLSRCYVWGFDPECIILCRSIIDAAFRDSIDDEICKRQGQYSTNSKGEYYFTLSNRIKAAFKEGIIDRRAKDMAFRIKERGDKAVHYQPDITKQVWETIYDTVVVLEKITQQ